MSFFSIGSDVLEMTVIHVSVYSEEPFENILYYPDEILRKRSIFFDNNKNIIFVRVICYVFRENIVKKIPIREGKIFSSSIIP